MSQPLTYIEYYDRDELVFGDDEPALNIRGKLDPETAAKYSTEQWREIGLSAWLKSVETPVQEREVA